MIKNCFNYVGSKDRIFPIIDRNLDKSKNVLVDLFCGSGVIGVNELANYEKVYLNDACWQLIETLNYFKNVPTEDVIREVDECVEKFNLSKTNKEGYDKLRDYYNNEACLKENFDPVSFYCLATHSFNYNIHINSSGGFSVPFGANRSYLNSSLKSKMKNFQEVLSSNSKKVEILSESFTTFVKKLTQKEVRNTVFYCDPPYLSSDSSYGRIHYLGKWDAVKEKELLKTLDYIHILGGSFLLSNVLENNGRVNEVLTKWSKKYYIIEVGTDYENCNYQRKNRGKTKEILIRNY